ncbi:MAG: ribonuclease domain-containing protein [Gallionellaceae bacterium]|nr:ribonuclease domain-containing protein [Gallionellaceae bacterium]
MSRSAATRWLLLLALGLLAWSGAQGFWSQPKGYDLQVAHIAGLPPEARQTLDRIKRGGPFPYPRDGIEFQNRENRLPVRSRNYYHEYTVATPGERTRGARRIISGLPGEYYYTPDHYRTFWRIRE